MRHNGGTPSGSGNTNYSGSLVNTLETLAAERESNPKSVSHNEKLLAALGTTETSLGDDRFKSYNKDFNFEKCAEILSKRFGVTMNPTKSERGPFFLQKYVITEAEYREYARDTYGIGEKLKQLLKRDDDPEGLRVLYPVPRGLNNIINFERNSSAGFYALTVQNMMRLDNFRMNDPDEIAFVVTFLSAFDKADLGLMNSDQVQITYAEFMNNLKKELTHNDTTIEEVVFKGRKDLLVDYTADDGSVKLDFIQG